MDKRGIRTLVILIGSSLLCACAAQPTESGLRASSEGFVLSIWPDSFIAAAPSGRFSLAVQPDAGAGGIEVTVAVEDARSLRALYFDLQYDPAQWHPLSAEPTGTLGAADSLLCLPHLAEPGRAYLGQVLIRPQEQAGFSGSGSLARLRFAPGPAPPDLSRRASAPGGPPAGPGAAPLLLWERQLEPVLRWRFGGPGDYDQNGEVNISDLTPLGANFGASGWFAPLSQHAAIDGDGNGEINLADITTIGSHYGERVDGYKVYSLHPDESGALSAQTSAQTSAQASAVLQGSIIDKVTGGSNMLFSIVSDLGKGLDSPPEEAAVVRFEAGHYSLAAQSIQADPVSLLIGITPFAGAEEGPLSNLVGGPASETQLEFEPPVPGTGTRLDPFLLGTEPTAHSFRLVHAVDGDVTAEFLDSATWVVSGVTDAQGVAASVNPLEITAQAGPPAAWQVSRLGAPLVNEVVISLQDKDAWNSHQPPGEVYFHLEDGSGANRPPIAVLHVDPPVPTQGEPFTLDASASVDPEGGALTYEFDPEGDGSFEPPTSDPQLELPGIFSPTAAAILQLTDNLQKVSQFKLEFRLDIATVPEGPDIELVNVPDECYPGVPVDIQISISDADGVASCSFSIDPPGAGTFENQSFNLDGALSADITNRFDPGVALGFATCTITGEDAGGHVNTQDFVVNITEPNSPPFPSLAIVPNPPREGDEIFLDATGSFDPDGTIELCRFDFENDGSWDAEVTAPAEFRVAHAYTEGSYTARIQLEDNQGAVNQIPAQLTFSVLPKMEWEVQVVCGGSGQDLGKHCSLARIGGFPAIAFQDVTAQDLTFVRAFDNYGDSWGFTPYTAALTPGVNDGLYAAMTHVSGGQPPLVLYYDADNKDLLAVRATTEAGSTWLAPVVVDGAASEVGKGISQCMLGGRQAAVYYGTGGMFFVTATDAGGLNWNAPVPIATGTVPTDPVSDLLAPAGGEFPQALGSFDDGLEFLGAGDSDGTTWQSAGVALGTVSNAVTSLDSFPGVRSDGISYVDAGSGELRFELAVGGDKTDWSGSHQIAGPAGTNPRRMDGGLFGEFLWSSPHYIIAVGADNGLTIYESTDNTGQSWKAPILLDASANAGAEGLSMSWVLGFNPVICWYAPATGELKYAIYR